MKNAINITEKDNNIIGTKLEYVLLIVTKY